MLWQLLCPVFPEMLRSCVFLFVGGVQKQDLFYMAPASLVFGVPRCAIGDPYVDIHLSLSLLPMLLGGGAAPGTFIFDELPFEFKFASITCLVSVLMIKLKDRNIDTHIFCLFRNRDLKTQMHHALRGGLLNRNIIEMTTLYLWACASKSSIL